MIMAGSVPGAMASNVMSCLTKADAAYSIVLTSILLSRLLTPAFVYIFANHIMQVKFWVMALSILKMVIPVILKVTDEYWKRNI